MNKNIKGEMSSMYKKQKGVTLVLVLVVLLAMTLLGIAATDSSGLQSLMARNSQFRMEAFNASNTEIEAQIDFLKATTSESEISPALTSLIRGEIGAELDAINDPDLVEVRSIAPEFQKDIRLTYVETCQFTGEDLSGSTLTPQCFVIGIDSNAEYAAPNIGSDQQQTIILSAF